METFHDCRQMPFDASLGAPPGIRGGFSSTQVIGESENGLAVPPIFVFSVFSVPIFVFPLSESWGSQDSWPTLFAYKQS